MPLQLLQILDPEIPKASDTGTPKPRNFLPRLQHPSARERTPSASENPQSQSAQGLQDLHGSGLIEHSLYALAFGAWSYGLGDLRLNISFEP